MIPFLSQAAWISFPFTTGIRSSLPCPFFRKSFHLKESPTSAKLAITALGLYEAEINGTRIGDAIFTPGWTCYDKRVQVQTYDITSLLAPGENVLGAVLGEGWYAGYLAWKGRQLYGNKIGLRASLILTFADGTTQNIITDSTWKVATGPIQQSDFQMGEDYDARMELPGWSAPGYDDSAWVDSSEFKPEVEPELSETLGPPVRAIETIIPDLTGDKTAHGNALRNYDFGQNFSGRIRMEVTAPAGTTFCFKHAEVLNPDGTLYIENLRGAKSTDYYVCKGGNALETWEPKFTFHGFRYLEVSAPASAEITGLKITGVVLHSDTPPTGQFSCSHPLLNQLQHNIVWGQKSNFLEVPTDCPQRDERLGWTGDAQVFVRTAAFNMDVRGFFHKWMRDARDSQSPRGGIPSTIPDRDFIGGKEDGGPAWSDANVICPWTIYLCYADRKILEDHYESMQRYVQFQLEHRCKGYIRSHPDVDDWGGYGDWLALDDSGKTEGATPRDLIGTAFLAYDAGIMEQVAHVLGRKQDEERYREIQEKTVEAFQNRFVTPAGLIMSATQTSYVLALHFNLLNDAQRKTAIAELVRDIEKRDFHIATGFVGTPYILEVLETAGRLDLAYRLLEQETFPSWLFPVKNGATTIWERWDGWTPEKGFQSPGMNSFNHYAYGAVGAWMYRSVAGLELNPQEPGYRNIIFRPRPGGSIEWAEASLKTAHGPVEIRWEKKENSLDVRLVVPEGCKGTFSAPENYKCETTEFGPGRHEFTLAG